MLIAGFPAGSWAANCYVVAAGPGAECVVVDPGQDAAPGVAEIVREHRLKPVAVLLTHGHIDHMWSVTPVAGTYDAPARIPPDDPPLLADPMAGISRETAAMLLGGRYEFVEPDDVAELADGLTLDLGGPATTAAPRPGGPQHHRRPHARPYPGLGHVPHAVPFDTLRTSDRGRLGRDVRRRPAVRWLDRPHRPPRG